jgi:hypothetical protein
VIDSAKAPAVPKPCKRFKRMALNEKHLPITVMGSSGALH